MSKNSELLDSTDPARASAGIGAAIQKLQEQFNLIAASPLRAAVATYDFDVHGGAIDTISLGVSIPSGAVVLGGYAEVETAPTSGGAGELAFQVEGAGDLVAAAAVSGAPWSTLGRKNVVPDFSGANSVKTTQARNVSAVISVAALTAGKVNVVLFYVVPGAADLKVTPLDG